MNCRSWNVNRFPGIHTTSDNQLQPGGAMTGRIRTATLTPELFGDSRHDAGGAELLDPLGGVAEREQRIVGVLTEERRRPDRRPSLRGERTAHMLVHAVRGVLVLEHEPACDGLRF